jgi:SET domain-containing protein
LTEGQKHQGNIAGFINSTQPRSTNKQPNCVFEGREGNHVFVCAIKSIVAGEELLINYNLNRIDTNIVTMGVVNITFHQTYN